VHALSHHGLQPVAKATQHADADAGARLFQLAAQAADMHLDHRQVGLVVPAVQRVEQALLGDGAAGMLHQCLDQRQLARGQLDALAFHLHFIADAVEAQPAQSLLRRCIAAAARQRTQAGFQLTQCERLGQVIIATAVEAEDAVLHAIACGQDQHRQGGAVVAQAREQVEAIDVGQ
jgi:hypothetical protein